MTVVLALRCADGIVLAADSQVTDSARGLSYPSQKLHPFGDTAAWGGSGARAVLMELEDVFDGCAAAVLAADNVGRAVQEQVIRYCVTTTKTSSSTCRVNRLRGRRRRRMY